MSNVPDYSKFTSAAPSTEDLKQLVELAAKLQSAELDVIEAQDTLKQKQAVVQHLSETVIPELMQKLGLEDLTLTNGYKLEIKDKLRTSIPEARQSEAFQWLENNGQAGVIKHLVSVSFERDQQAAVEKLMKTLVKQFPHTKQERWVEPATLKKIIGDKIKAGTVVPQDLFGVHQFKLATIKESKKKGSKSRSVFGE